MKSWLITGGCGFIGSSLIACLLKENLATRIRVLDNFSVGAKEDLAEVCRFTEVDMSSTVSQTILNPSTLQHHSNVELISGDIRDYNACLKSCKDIDTVVHLAANTGVAPSIENPRGDMEANVIGTFNMLDAARQGGAERFIFASSGASIGEVDPPIHEEKTPRPVSPYGASKLAGEGYCSSYHRTFGLKTIALRFGNVYGPRSKHKSSVVAKFFRQALLGEILEIYGDGNQTRDFIFIDDLIQAIKLAARAEIGGEVFQIATHKETTVNEVARKIKELVEKRTGRAVNIMYKGPRLGDVRRNYSDISKAKKMLGYWPVYDLEKGLQQTFEYFHSKI